VRQRRIVVTAIAYDHAYAISRGEACHVEFEAAVLSTDTVPPHRDRAL